MRRVLVIALDLAGVGVESERRVRVEVVAGPVAGDDFAAHRKRRQGRVTTRFIVIDWNSPNLLARSGVKSNERTVGRRHVDVVTVQRDPTVGWMELEQAIRVLPCVAP